MASINASQTLLKIVQAYFNGGTFKGMLLTNSYSPDEDNHDFRDDLTATEASGTGYTAGGAAVTATVSFDSATDQVRVTFSSPSWASSSVTARYLAIYKVIGSAATDEIVCIIDNGSAVTSSSSTFTFTVSSPLVFQN